MIKGLGKHGHRVVSVIITFAVIGMLLAVGPASAFNLGLNVETPEIALGQEAHIQVSFTAENGDAFVPVQEFQFSIENGEYSQTCHFMPDGTPISGCEGMTITPSGENELSYGYGYGYGYYGSENYNFGYGYGVNVQRGQVLAYDVSIDSIVEGEPRPQGEYNAMLSALIEDSLFDSDSGTFVIGDFLLGDINKDGFVNQEDLDILIYLWGPVTDYGNADFNEDGIVNGADLGDLLGHWGACPVEGDCPWDLNFDGVVNQTDTNILLSQWGIAGQEYDADLDDNGIVDGADLGTLLGNWTG